MHEWTSEAQLRNLKLRALDAKQDFSRLSDLYGEFQQYVELVAKAMNGDVPWESLARPREALRLSLEDQQQRFLEWCDGDQILNSAVFSFVINDGFDLAGFKSCLMQATLKFEHLLKNSERSLRELREQISILADEAEAERITELPRQMTASEKLKNADTAGEMAIKWGQRLIEFAPWAKRILDLLQN